MRAYLFRFPHTHTHTRTYWYGCDNGRTNAELQYITVAFCKSYCSVGSFPHNITLTHMAHSLWAIIAMLCYAMLCVWVWVCVLVHIRKRRKKSIPFLANSFRIIFSMYNVSDRLWNGLAYAAQLNRLRVGEADKDVDRNSRALMLFGRQRSSLLLYYTFHVCAYYCRWKIASCVFFFVTNNIVRTRFVHATVRLFRFVSPLLWYYVPIHS